MSKKTEPICSRLSQESVIETIKGEPSRFVFLLGAGVSYSAGILIASEIIKYLKKELYLFSKGLAENDLSETYERGVYEEKLNLKIRGTLTTIPMGSQDIDAAVEEWCNKQEWFNKNKPYSSVLQKRFPLPDLRRQFFERLCEGKNPTAGHEALAMIVTSPSPNRPNIILTTNFDRLMDYSLLRQLRDKGVPYIARHDWDVRGVPLESPIPKLLKLHGDYLYDDIANLDPELKEKIEGSMGYIFREALRGRGLVVVGYGGNDDTIMGLLDQLAEGEAYFTHGMYWTSLREPGEGDKRIIGLLNKFERRGATGAWVRIERSDTFFMALAKALNIEKGLDVSQKYDLEKYKSELTERLRTEPLLKSSRTLENSKVTLRDLSGLTKEEEGETIEIDELLDKSTSKLLMVIGEPGSGKTTGLRRLAYHLLQHGLAIPVIIPLRHYKKEHANLLECGGITPPLSISLKENGQSIVLLCDGLEDVPEDSKVLAELKTLSEIYYCVVTCRTVNYVHIPDFKVFEILELREPAIYEFVVSELGPERGEILYAHIVKEKALRELSKNPLMLTILVRTYEQSGKIARNRMDLFDRFASGYLSSRAGEEEVMGRKQTVLSRMAYRLNVSNRNITRLDLEQLVKDTGFDEVQAKVIVTELLNSRLIKEETEPGTPVKTITFLHPTLESYFAIKEFEQLLQNSPDDFDFHKRLAKSYSALLYEEKVREHFTEALRLGPDEAGMYSMYASFLRSIGKELEALDVLQKGLENCPEEAVLYRLYSIIAYRLKKSELSLTFLRKAHKLRAADDTVYVLLGKYLAEQKSYSEAEQVFKEGLDLFPEYPGLYDCYASMLRVQRRYLEAAEVYERGIEKCRGTPKLSSSYAGMLSQQGAFEKAARVLEEAVSKFPTNTFLYQSLASAYRRNGDLENAKKAYEQGIRNCPRNSQLFEGLISVLVKLDQWEEANRIYNKSVEQFPGNPNVHKIFGNLLAGAGKATLAEEVFEKGLKYCPDNRHLYSSYAQMLEKHGKAEAAIELYKKGIKRCSDRHELFVEYTRLLEAQGKIVEAELRLKESLESYPYSPDVYRDYANLLKRQRRNKDAERVLEKGMKVCPNNNLVCRDYGEMLWKYKPDKVIEAYKRAIEANKDNSTFYYDFAIILKKMGRKEEAAGIFQQGVENCFGGPYLYKDYGNLLFELGRMEEAQSIFEEGIKKFSDVEGLYKDFAGMQIKMGEYDMAEETYRKGIKNCQGNTDLFHKLASVLRDRRWYGQARDVLEEGLRLHPGNPHLQKAYSEILKKLENPGGEANK